MKTHLLYLSLAVMSLIAFSSCDSDPDYWWDEPGNPPGAFNDSRLTGYWQLVQYNSDAVPANEANYMYFNGNGRGYYYYLSNGQKQVETIRYRSIDTGTGASNYMLDINYQYSNPLSTSYWFTHGDDVLWMQWQTGNNRVQTYVYDRIDGAPW